MKKAKIILSLLLILILTISCSSKQTSLSDSITLTVIHINDRHGRMEADPYISQFANDLRAKDMNVLILDAGDTLHGQVTANLTKGASMVELMNAVGYSAMVFGNHEFNYGIDRMLELEAMMNFPLLVANVKKDGVNIFQEYEIFTIAGIKIGVFGIVTPETPITSDPRLTVGLEFEDPMQTAIRIVNELQTKEVDFIISLAHLGDNQTTLAENKVDALVVPGVNLIIDGHSHTLLPNGRNVGNTLIVQAGEFANHFGIVKITIEKGEISQIANTIEVNETLKPDDLILSKIIEINKSTESITSEIVGYTPYFLNGERSDVRTKDTNLSNLITDSMRYISNADIGFISGGSIRASIPKGNITMGHVLSTIPFSNLIVTIELNGSIILEALEHGVSAYPDEMGSFLQFSGLNVIFDPSAEAGSRIKSVTMYNNEPFDINRTYTVAMIEFLSAGGDGYTMLTLGENLVYYGGDAEAFVAYLLTNPVINEEGEGRILKIDN